MKFLLLSILAFCMRCKGSSPSSCAPSLCPAGVETGGPHVAGFGLMEVCHNEGGGLCAAKLLASTCEISGNVDIVLCQLENENAKVENAKFLAGNISVSVDMLVRNHELLMNNLQQLSGSTQQSDKLIASVQEGAEQLKGVLKNVTADTVGLQAAGFNESLLTSSFNIAEDLQQMITVVAHNVTPFLLDGGRTTLVVLRGEIDFLKLVANGYPEHKAITIDEITIRASDSLNRAVEVCASSRTNVVLSELMTLRTSIENQLPQLLLATQVDIADATFSSQKALGICNQIQEALELDQHLDNTLLLSHLLTETQYSITRATVQGNQSALLLKDSLRVLQDFGDLFAKFKVCVRTQFPMIQQKVLFITQHAATLSRELLDTKRVAADVSFPDSAIITSRLSALNALALETVITLSNVTIRQLPKIPDYIQFLLVFINSSQSLTAKVQKQVSSFGDRLSSEAGTLNEVTQQYILLDSTISTATGRSNEVHVQAVMMEGVLLSHASVLRNTLRLLFINATVSALNDDIGTTSVAVDEAEELLNRTSQISFADIANNSTSVQLKVTILQSVADIETGLTEAKSIAKTAEGIVDNTFEHFNQILLPVMFSLDSVLSVEPPEDGADGQFRNLLLVIGGAYPTDDVVMIHLVQIYPFADQNITLTVGNIDGSLFASFVISGPLSSIESTNLILPVNSLSNQYSIEVTRTDRIVHLYLHDLDTGESVNTSTLISSRLAFHLGAGFSNTAQLHIGGAPLDSSIENTAFANTANYTGCINTVSMNAKEVKLWTSKTGYVLRPCIAINCLQNTLRPLQFSLNGSEYAQTELTGTLFPLRVNFQTFIPNGLLLFARSRTEASSLQISLIYGNIVITVSADDRRRTLTSLQTYASGADQHITLSLTRSQRSLVLTSDREETTRGLQFIQTSSVLNYTETYIGGVGQDLSDEIRNNGGNFTGCLAVSLQSAQCDPLPFSCVGGAAGTTYNCRHCFQQAVLPASFYGASYTSFPSITPGVHFDLSFSFLTVFPNALLMYSGNASEGAWFAVGIVSGRLQLQFGSAFGEISLPVTRAELNIVDGQWHTVTILRESFTLNILIDGANALSSLFGSIFPRVPLTTDLYIGGVAPEEREVVRFGVDTTGFIGSLDDMYVMGRRLDFMQSLWSEQVTLDAVSADVASGWRDAYSFNGTAFAEFDLGRFEPDFSIGFQFNTLNANGLLLYIFSRKRSDAFAVQIMERMLQVYIVSEEGEANVSYGLEVSDGYWHAVTMEKRKDVLTLFLNGTVVDEVSGLPLVLRTNTDLFIGGIPNDRRIPLPDVVTSQGFNGHFRINYLSHATLFQVQPASKHEFLN